MMVRIGLIKPDHHSRSLDGVGGEGNIILYCIIF